MGDFLKYFKVSINDFYIYTMPGIGLIVIVAYFFPGACVWGNGVLDGIGLSGLGVLQRILVLVVLGSFLGVLITPISSVIDGAFSKLLRRDKWSFLKIDQNLAKHLDKKISKLYPGVDLSNQNLYEWLYLILNEENSMETERIGIEQSKDAMIRNVAYALMFVIFTKMSFDGPSQGLLLGLGLSLVMVLIYWYRQNVATSSSLLRVSIERERRTSFGKDKRK